MTLKAPYGTRHHSATDLLSLVLTGGLTKWTDYGALKDTFLRAGIALMALLLLYAVVRDVLRGFKRQ